MVTAFKVGKVYRIEWLDHHDVSQTWVRAEDIPEDQEVRFVSIGLCIKNEKMYVTLAGTEEIVKTGTPTYGNVFRCLKADIQSAREIKL